MKLVKLNRFFYFRLILPLADLVMHTTVIKWYHQIRKMNKWKHSEINKWQSNRLNELVNHFYNNTVYYKRVFDEHGIDPKKITKLEELQNVPILTKKLIHDHFDELVPLNLSTIHYKNAATGGSTGDPLKYYLDLESWSYTTASNVYSFELKGLNYGEKYIALGSSSLYPTEKKSQLHMLYYKLRNKVPMNGMNMSDDVMNQYINYILENKIRFIYGYASALFLLAKYVNTKNLPIHLSGCFTTSEVLTNEYREEINKAFHCQVMDGYGARDGGITADELTPGYYHVGYNTMAEVVDCFKKDTGKLIITDLLNYAFPFIRYDIGDEATLLHEESDIYNGQVITQVFGRESHVIRLENGNVLTGPGFTILFKDINAISYKIYKTGPLQIKIDIQPNNKYTIEEEKLILNTFKKHAGKECEIEIRYIDSFETEKNGKRNYFMK